MSIFGIRSTVIDGDALAPADTDLIAQVAQLAVGEPVPEGWRVLTGNAHTSQVARVCYRFELGEEPKARGQRFAVEGLHKAARRSLTVLEGLAQIRRPGDAVEELENALHYFDAHGPEVEAEECRDCDGTGIESGRITADAGDGEGEDRPCPSCA